jgi:polysaccharide biosynthesis/export protein
MKTISEKILLLSLAVLCLAWLGGCGPRLSPELRAQAAAAAIPDPEVYTLGPEDAIEVSVWKEPELTRELVVRPDGKISYPLVGEIQAAGLTVNELQQEISRELEQFVTVAEVTVILLKAQHYKLYVIGQVAKPGEYIVGRPTNVLQALAMAGGLTPFASPRAIRILRQVQDREEIYPFNYHAVTRGYSLEQNMILLPGDVVMVP